jgi:hypothetical protein
VRSIGRQLLRHDLIDFASRERAGGFTFKAHLSVGPVTSLTALLAPSRAGVSMRTKETGTDSQPRQRERLTYAHAQNLSREVWAFAHRRPGVFSTTSGPVVVAAVFCLVFLVMGTAF